MGATPYAGTARTAPCKRLAQPLGGIYTTFLSLEEPGAYAAGATAALAELSAAIRRNDSTAPELLATLLDVHLGGGVSTSLASIATSKQSLAALAEGRAKWLHPSASVSSGDRHYLRIDRGRGRTFAIAYENAGFGAMRDAIDAALGVFGRTSSRTWFEIREQLAWQQRAAHEHLNLFRVASQALQPPVDAALPDARICDAAAYLAEAGRAAYHASASPITFE